MAETPIEDKAVQADEVAYRGLGSDIAVHVAQGVASGAVGGAAGAYVTHLLRPPKNVAPSPPTPTEPTAAPPAEDS